ncbi:MAG TPA: N-acetylglucosamine-6-phosphate deacetylase [Gordonibacter urolithinfaciens]|uniref:N-acetylglucosamine-6-phosphate deacetylase n=1 Tax=Gordonibacter urolithinfaciens TaxID=1335613 RepID=UPI001DDB1994|nr:N-acetylglucosamine-6-phosphate deacetylase [Gordonibacter urolithinfaciens]HJF63471.1 N-acetylglucosamine-6-phosphate deacetylase [Gordonibacter urolithinfaciens]
MRIINGSVFVGEGFVERDVFVADGRFVGEAARAEGGQTVDAAGCYVIPGLVDLHFHGSAGADISDGDLAGLHRMGAYEASRGITAMCPATMTLPEDVLMRAAQAAAAYAPAADEAALVGINMEGPFISPSKVGAQNPDYVRNPSADEFRRLQEAADGLFKLVDIAPEEPGAEEFIREMAGEVRISLAHTCTDYDTAVRAFELGARQLTHLYNAMDPMHHRKPGPIPAAVEHGEVAAEIIADGVHIHPAMVRLAFQLFGDDRMILISDTLRAAGLEDGTYDLGGQDVTVRGPVATIDNGALAGSVSDLMRCLTVAVRDMGIPLASAVKAASANPARALGLDAERGAIEAGKVADAVLLDKETLDVRAVVLRGELLA